MFGKSTPYSVRRSLSLLVAVAAFLTLFGAESAHSQEKNEATPRYWKPVPDEPYLQEIGSKVPTTKPITAAAVLEGSLYAVMSGTLYLLKNDQFEEIASAPKSVHQLKTLNGVLFAITENGLYQYDGKAWTLLSQDKFVDLCLYLGQVYAATKDDIYRLVNGKLVNIKPPSGFLSNDSTVVMEDFSQVLADPVQIGPVSQIASYSGTLYILRSNGLALLDGAVLQPSPIDWGHLPSPNTRAMLPLGSKLYLGTDRGLGVLRGMAMTTIRGTDGLPVEDITCLAQGFDNDLWIGTSQGAVRKLGDEYHYFGASHWLPGDKVNAIAVAENCVYIATDGGLGVIRYEPYTLQKKAAYFERELDVWGFKRLGFVHTLYWNDKEGWLREISDNDGGNSAHYLAAMTFKYAATGDEKARQEAVRTFKAIAWLGDITTKSGFIARAIWSIKADKGEIANRGSGGLPAKWYKTKDGLWIWKGDTSSDEVNGHMYAVSLFHDLAAKGAEKARARDHLAHISAHIIDNGWVLRDMDGKPTRWGRWDPAYLQGPYGIDSRGLNGMEAQTYMHTAFALTGDKKFQDGLQQLIKWRYPTYTVRQKLTFPPDSMVTWDDELAFRCYMPLLRYAKDPALRSIYLRSLERTWEVLRMQRQPFFNFIYGALTGNDCEVPEAVKSLREWSLDLVGNSYHNSHRADLAPRKDYVPYGMGTRALSMRDIGASWDSGATLQYDGGNGGKTVTPPMAWLEDYWMGRYYGFIQPPTTKERTLLLPGLRQDRRPVAVPYSGPEPAELH